MISCYAKTSQIPLSANLIEIFRIEEAEAEAASLSKSCNKPIEILAPLPRSGETF
jgi:hypothetical protein